MAYLVQYEAPDAKQKPVKNITAQANDATLTQLTNEHARLPEMTACPFVGGGEEEATKL